MANFCGGIKLDKNSLKVINGVICDANATSVDRSKAVFTCGQLWDGALFTVVKVGGAGYITLHNSEGEEVGAPVIYHGNCGVGLDGRFFKVVNGGCCATRRICANCQCDTIRRSDGCYCCGQ